MAGSEVDATAHFVSNSVIGSNGENSNKFRSIRDINDDANQSNHRVQSGSVSNKESMVTG